MSTIYCNPLQISYKYQHPLHGKYAYKEAADPTLILFKGTYYLFTSKCGGFYYSDDLFNWKFHSDRNLEIHGYAPDVNQHNGYLYFCASAYLNKCKILRSKDPLNGFELVSQPFTFWDPHLYFEDDKAYLYWGCSSKEPIYGIEMDPDTMTPIGEKKGLIYCDDKNHGIDNKKIYKDLKISTWQKFVNIFTGSGTFIEGVFLNKIDNTYYFQYATPGTEFPTYANAVFTSTSPLGKLTWQKHNPFSIVPKGYIQGAGHGSTFYDKYNNLWHTASCCVGVNHNFERRLGLWPAGVDKDGILFCNQYFSDYPKDIPNGKFDPLSIEPNAMLLSFKKNVIASSQLDECKKENVVDESIKTMYSSASSNPGEFLEIDLGKQYLITSIQVNFGDYHTKKKKAPRKEYGGTISQERYIEDEEVKYQYKLLVSEDNQNWQSFESVDILTTLPHRLAVCEKMARYVKIIFENAPYNQNFVLSGLRVFGKDINGSLPKQVEKTTAKRIDNTTGIISFEKSSDAIGHCIRLGISEDKLYNSILLYDDNEYKITFLNSEVDTYYYAIDSFNETGITKGKVLSFSK